ncbi:hypothetical protein APS67_003874 [Streptomyces sp. AVP053U2]|nr:hypothetical protein APS67_003874 [Streptomyces sp. AVP053U2]
MHPNGVPHRTGWWHGTAPPAGKTGGAVPSYRTGSVDGALLLGEHSADDVLGERLRRTDGLRGSVG